MAAIDVIDIRPSDLEIIQAILRRHVSDCEVWAFGSRVHWTAQDHSDLDLAIRSVSPIPTSILSALRDDFSESNLPMKVDVLDMASVDEKFRKLIEEEYAVIYPRDSVLLSEVAKITMGQSPPGSTYNTDGVGFPFYQGVADFQDRYPKKRVFCIAPTRFAEQGDILLSVRAPIGRVNLAIERCAIGRGLASIRAVDFEDQTFLEFALRQESDNWRILESQGSVFGNAKKSDLMDLPIPWPRREHRRAIARVLGALDDKIEINRRMNTTLETIAQALFRSWFIDFAPVHTKSKGRNPGLPPQIAALFPSQFTNSRLGMIPEGWKIRSLGDVSRKPQYGYTASANSESIGPKFLRITDINKAEWIEWDKVPYCEISDLDFMKYRLHKGDILIARMADPGHGVVIEENREAVFASYLIRFRPIQKQYARFFQYWLRSGWYWKLVRERIIGTTRSSLNAKSLSEFPVIIPSLQLAAEFSRIVDCLRDRVVENVLEMESIEAMRDALIPKLLSGELRVKV